MKKADKSGAKYAVIVGEDELKQSQVSVKDMRDSSEQKSVSTAGLLKLLKKEKNNG
jgi:histidyl-tRNA synthetase